ncbi:MAG: 23S rRNA (pseudouridine(1915)-N(3))-methyltransferase RlmH, partial [Lachnospiraceae bacterium]
MKITIVCVGKVKEKYLRDAIAEYEKRLSRYCKLQVIEVADEKTPDGASTVVEDQIREKEAERILKNLRLDDPVVTLEIEGKQMDSVAFAQKIEQMGVEGVSH